MTQQKAPHTPDMPFHPRKYRKADLIDALRNVAPTCLPGNASRQDMKTIYKASFNAMRLKGDQFTNEVIRLAKDTERKAAFDAANAKWPLPISGDKEA
jgi:hypothetical protein